MQSSNSATFQSSKLQTATPAIFQLSSKASTPPRPPLLQFSNPPILQRSSAPALQPCCAYYRPIPRRFNATMLPVARATIISRLCIQTSSASKPVGDKIVLFIVATAHTLFSARWSILACCHVEVCPEWHFNRLEKVDARCVGVVLLSAVCQHTKIKRVSTNAHGCMCGKK